MTRDLHQLLIDVFEPRVGEHVDSGWLAYAVEAALVENGLIVIPGWRKIEEAPKDGTEILISRTYGEGASAHTYVEAAYWSQCQQAVGGNHRYPWVTLDHTNVVNGRSDDEHGPTHFLDLSALPKPKEGE